MNRLPLEILSEIFSYLPAEPWELAKYTSVCKTTSNFVLSNLYRSVYLLDTGSTRAQNKARGKLHENPTGRQALLLETLASNASLAALVHEFRNDKEDDWTVMPEADPKMLGRVADNMKRLQTAYVSYNFLAVQLITSPAWTTTMSSLTIDRFSVEDFIWPPETRTALLQVSWTTPLPGENEYQYSKQSVRPDLLEDTMKIFALTCPRLASLELKGGTETCWVRSSVNWDFEGLVVGVNNFAKYDSRASMEKMRNLKHFGLEGWMYMEDSNALDFYRENISSAALPTSRAFMEGFLEEYKDQLTSLTWDFSNYPREPTFLESQLAKLHHLSKFGVSGFTTDSEQKLSGLLKVLSESCGGCLSELTIGGANGQDFGEQGGPPLSKDYGHELGEDRFPNLRILRVSTRPPEKIVDGGYLLLEEYYQSLRKWSRQLPKSLTQLNVDVFAEGTRVDDIAEEFFSFAEDLIHLFAHRNLPRLRRCDLSWDYTASDGCKDREEVIFRRTKTQASPPAEQDGRYLLVWWIGSEFEHSSHRTVKNCKRYSLKGISDRLEGEDDEIWKMPLDERMVLYYGCTECENSVIGAKNLANWKTGELDDDNDDEETDSESDESD